MKNFLLYLYKKLLKQILNSDMGLSEKYDLVIAPYKKILNELPLLSDKVSEDSKPLFLFALQSMNKVLTDEEVKKEAKVLYENIAQEKATMLKCYVDSGFTREEAMKLVISDYNNLSK